MSPGAAALARLLFALPAIAAPPLSARLEAEYGEVSRQLAGHIQAATPDDDPSVPGLIARSWAGAPTAGLASPEAAAAARDLVTAARQERLGPGFSPGMIAGSQLTRSGDDRLLCLALDGGAYVYRLQPHRSGLVVTAVTPVDGDCGR